MEFVVNLEEFVAKEKPLEEQFDLQLKGTSLAGEYLRDVAFIPGRKYRADFWFPARKLAVEVDGGIFLKHRSGHTSGSGYHKDRVRDQIALSEGIMTIRFTTPQIRNGEALEYLLCFTGSNGQPFRQSLPKDFGESTSGKAKAKRGGK